MEDPSMTRSRASRIRPLCVASAFGLAAGWPAGADCSFTGLGDLAGGAFESGAAAISADGAIVVGYGESASGLEAFRWTSAGGMVGLGDLAGDEFESGAHGVSADGLTVVGYGVSASGVEAFRWTSAGGMVGLGDFTGGEFFSQANDVSADGSVVVGGARRPARPNRFGGPPQAGWSGSGRSAETTGGRPGCRPTGRWSSGPT